LDDVNVLCYEPHACKSIIFNGEKISDAEAEKYFKICTKEEINEILSQKTQIIKKKSISQDDNISNINPMDEKSNSTFIIILGCIIFILISFFVSFIFIKKNKSRKNKKSDSDFTNESQTNIITKNNQNNNNTNTKIYNNNDNNNNIDEINNNNNNYNNNNNNNSNNNNNNNVDKNNLNQNKNIMVNLNTIMKDIYQEDSNYSFSLSF